MKKDMLMASLWDGRWTGRQSPIAFEMTEKNWLRGKDGGRNGSMIVTTRITADLEIPIQ